MISIVIRNKNESEALKFTLKVLFEQYKGQFEEVILVDNNSDDDSVKVATSFGCRIVEIEDFSYGRAINLGVKEATQPWVLLLSAHALPIGDSFFKQSLNNIHQVAELAGIRYINSGANYKRALQNEFVVKDGLSHGLMAACALIKRSVVLEYPFNESLVASEDKEWSARVMGHGYRIIDIPETYLYFANRSKWGRLKRWAIELEAHYLLHNEKFPGPIKIIGATINKILFKNSAQFFREGWMDLQKMNRKIKIGKRLRRNKQ